MIVTIDGPAGSGKSTIAKLLAQKLNLLLINSGNYYRAVTLYLLSKNFYIGNKEILHKYLEEIEILETEDNFFLNNLDVKDKLTSEEVEKNVAHFSSLIEVRSFINERLRQKACGKDVVAEGRDAGSVIFPDADLKIYLDANLNARAKRRQEQYSKEKTLEQVKIDIQDRDSIDSQKKAGRLRVSTDSYYIDSSDLTLQELCDKIILRISNIRESHE